MWDTNAMKHGTGLNFIPQMHSTFWCPFHLQAGKTLLNVGNLSCYLTGQTDIYSVHQIRISAMSMVIYTIFKNFKIVTTWVLYSYDK